MSTMSNETDDDLYRARRLLLKIEGTILGYWTDIPQYELERLRQEIREELSNFEP